MDCHPHWHPADSTELVVDYADGGGLLFGTFNAILALFQYHLQSVSLTLISQLFRKLSPNLGFRQSELLTIYIMLNLSAALVGHSMLQILPPTMAAPLGLATLENEWSQLFGQYIPTWLAISDPPTLEAYIQGTKANRRCMSLGISGRGLCPCCLVSVCLRLDVRQTLHQRHPSETVDGTGTTRIPNRPVAV